MQFSVLGLNHNTAPVIMREKLAVSAEMRAEVYTKLLSSADVNEAMVLSTCNRVEYYIVAESVFDKEAVLATVANVCGVEIDVLRKHAYIHCGTDATRHLVSVASGIDSLVLGEPQIFGQVKDAFRFAREHKGIRAYLNRLEQFVLKTTKKVRTNTGISENAVSVSYAAVDLAKKIFGTLESKKALVIGAGEMCELAVEHLTGANIGGIIVTNRTFSKAEELARRFYGRAVEFDKFADMMHEVDIVISSTGAPKTVVNAEMVAAAMAKRKRAPMFFIDIAVPRDIDEAVNNVENAYVYDIDDLKQVVEANRKERENEAEKAMALITGAVVQFERFMDSLRADPIVVSLRKYADNVSAEVLEKYCRKNKITDPEEINKLQGLLLQVMNKLLHTPTVTLKASVADNKQIAMVDAVAKLFKVSDK